MSLEDRMAVGRPGPLETAKAPWRRKGRWRKSDQTLAHRATRQRRRDLAEQEAQEEAEEFLTRKSHERRESGR